VNGVEQTAGAAVAEGDRRVESGVGGVMQLGEITEPKIDQAGPTSSGEFTYVDISSVDNNAKRIVGPKRLPTESAPSRARQRLRSGDVLVSMTRPNLNAVALVPPELDGAIGSTGFYVLRARDNVLPQWLFYGVQARQFVGAMSELVQGALYPAVRPKDIRAFDLPVPALAEQRRIVAEIEKQFSRLDEAVTNLERVKANLQHYVAATLRAAFAGELVPKEADLARLHGRTFARGSELLASLVLTRNGRQSKAAGLPPTSIGEHAIEGWAWTTLGECFMVAVGATPSRKEPAYWGGSVSWVSSGEVQFSRVSRTNESITEGGLANSSTQINPAGSVLLGMIGQGRTRGQAAILDIPAANNQNCAAIWVSQTPVPPEFVYYWLMSRYEQTRGEGSGNNQQALNKKLVEAIPLPLPPLREQHRIVAEVDRRLSIVREVVAEVDANLKRAQALRQAVLGRAFALPPLSHPNPDAGN
jgi:type I restriction enzyme, S subunit